MTVGELMDLCINDWGVITINDDSWSINDWRKKKLHQNEVIKSFEANNGLLIITK